MVENLLKVAYTLCFDCYIVCGLVFQSAYLSHIFSWREENNFLCPILLELLKFCCYHMRNDLNNDLLLELLMLCCYRIHSSFSNMIDE